MDAGVAFDNEIVRDDNELRQQIVDDFWRKHFYNATNRQLDQLAYAKLTPETLANSVAKWVSKPYVNVLPLQLDSACEMIEINLHRALDKAKTIWTESSEDINKLLTEYEGLKRNSYKIETLPDKLHQLDTIINTTKPGLLSKDEMKNAQLFTASVLTDKTKKTMNHHNMNFSMFGKII
ncbi:MAG: hypothetical protein V3V22_01640 [Methylococcales bacterium]